MTELSPDRDLYEVDDPTQPFSRSEIETMRRNVDDRAAAGPRAVIALVEEPAPPPVDLTSEVADELLEAMATVKILNPLVPIEGPDWFELSGRRIRISVDRFGQFGNSGTPPGMIGASHSSFLYGQIGGEPNVPCQPLPRLTAVYPAASDIDDAALTPDEILEIEDFVSARRWRALLFVAALAVLVAGGGWSLARGRSAPAVIEDAKSSGVASAQPRQPEPVASIGPPSGPATEPDKPALVEQQVEHPQETKPKQKPSSTEASAPRHRRPECVRHRGQAQDALRRGKWTELDGLAQRTECWSSSRTANALRLRALFELERYRECVELGRKAKSKEEKKWLSNCKRALP